MFIRKGKTRAGNPKNWKHSDKTKQKIKIARAKQPSVWIGKKHPGYSAEYKNKMKVIAVQKGYGKWMKGKKHSDVTKKKIGDAEKGVKNWAWRGGVSFLPYPPEFNKELKIKIRERDNYTCCLCGRTEREELEELNRVLAVNHIDFNKQNCKEENLNTLCLRCNTKICRDRGYWTSYFQSQI